MEVLKDASATAIYGSRGSTGVVIITTKLGKEGKTRFDINPWVKKEEIAKELPLMNAYQFGVATNYQYTSTGSPAAFSAAQLQAFQTTNKGTDWPGTNSARWIRISIVEGAMRTRTPRRWH